MTNEELMQAYVDGDDNAIEGLYNNNIKYIKKILYTKLKEAKIMNRAFAKDCESIAVIELYRLIRNKKYDKNKALFITYITRYIERVINLQIIKYNKLSETISLDYLNEQDHWNPIPQSLEFKTFNIIALEMLRELFLSLTEREQDLLGAYYGIYGYEKLSIDEIAISQRLTTNGALKAIWAAQKSIFDPDSKLYHFENLWEGILEDIRIAQRNAYLSCYNLEEKSWMDIYFDELK